MKRHKKCSISFFKKFAHCICKIFCPVRKCCFIIADIVDVNEMISFSATETPHWRESKVWTEEICLPRSYRIMNKLKHFITKGDNCTHTNTHTQTLKKNPRILHKHPNFFLWKKEVFFNKLKCNLQYICVRINVESGALLFLCFIEILTGKKNEKYTLST